MMDILYVYTGIILIAFIGQSSSNQDLLISADCYNNQFSLYSTNGTKLASRTTFKSCPESIAFADYDSEKVYWIEDTRPPSIRYLKTKNGNFASSSHQVDLPAGLDHKSIQVDRLNGLVYFIVNQSIVVKSLKENMAVILGIPRDSKPSLIAIDPYNKHLFWHDNHIGGLFKANMDGSNAQKIRTVNSVNAVILDIPEQRIYTATEGMVFSTSYDGTSPTRVLRSGNSAKILSITLDSTRLFYTVENNSGILCVNKSSTMNNYGTLFATQNHPNAVGAIVTSYPNLNKLPNQCSAPGNDCNNSLCVTKGPVDKICLSGIPKDAEVRPSTGAGKVEVKLRGQWHTVCSDNFGVDEAIVVCRNSRHFGKVDVLTPQPGTSKMIELMRCPYSAVSPSTCVVSYPSSTCNGGAAAVNCQAQYQGMAPDTDEKKLGGGTRASEGRLEVFHQGAWSPVCDPVHSFNKDAADALCWDLGYRSGNVASKTFTEKNVTSWRQDIKCYIGVRTLEYCYTSPWQQVTCNPDDIIAVECFPQAPVFTTTGLTTTQIRETTKSTFPDLPHSSSSTQPIPQDLDVPSSTTEPSTPYSDATTKTGLPHASLDLDASSTTTISGLPDLNSPISTTKFSLPDMDAASKIGFMTTETDVDETTSPHNIVLPDLPRDAAFTSSKSHFTESDVTTTASKSLVSDMDAQLTSTSSLADLKEASVTSENNLPSLNGFTTSKPSESELDSSITSDADLGGLNTKSRKPELDSSTTSKAGVPDPQLASTTTVPSSPDLAMVATSKADLPDLNDPAKATKSKPPGFGLGTIIVFGNKEKNIMDMETKSIPDNAVTEKTSLCLEKKPGWMVIVAGCVIATIMIVPVVILGVYCYRKRRNLHDKSLNVHFIPLVEQNEPKLKLQEEEEPLNYRSSWNYNAELTTFTKPAE